MKDNVRVGLLNFTGMAMNKWINLVFIFVFLSFSCTGLYVSSLIEPIKESETYHIIHKDTKIYYHTIGDKSNPPVVFLHGILGFTQAYRDIIEILAEKYYIIGIDMRGHGRSSIGNQSYSYQLIAEDVIRVTDQIGVNRFHVIGHSGGGIVLLSIAKYFPDKIIKGVSIASLYNQDGISYRKGQDDYITKEGFKDNVDGRNNRLVKFYDRVYKKLGEEEKFIKTKKTLMEFGTDMFPSFSESDLHKIENPMLVIVAGDDDRIKPDHTKKMSGLLPNSTLLEVPKAKHFNIVKRKKNLNIVLDRIFNFLK